MVKPRMCFALLYGGGKFHLSRNFNLQAVGDLKWLMENYEFESIARSIDELVILNVARDAADWPDFVRTVQIIVRRCFMPVAVGGGIRAPEHGRLLFENGADKIIINYAFFQDPGLVRGFIRSYGAQSIIASLDFKRTKDGRTRIFIDGGRRATQFDLPAGIARVKEVGAGEIYLTAIDRDGTGMGYDLPALKIAFHSCDLPIIAAGGADTYDRLAEGIKSGFASAVATAHLFNFMGDGLKYARKQIEADGIELSRWNFKDLV